MQSQRGYVQRGKRGTRDAKRKREWHEAEQQLFPNINAAAYHRQKLVQLLEDADIQHDQDRVAMLSAALLAAQDYKHLPGPEKTPGGLHAAYFQQVGAAGYEALYQQASFDELRRYLRKLQHHQPDPAEAEIVLLEMAYLLAEHGEYQEAYDVLDSYADRSIHHFQRHAVCGFLRHAQATELMQRTAAEMKPGQGSSQGAIKLNLFQFHEQVWTRCGQQLQEFWASSESHFKEALRLQPQAVEQGCLLAQLYMMRGQLEDALEIAAALREAAPQDADAHGLYVLLLEADGPDMRSKDELASAYVCLLRCHPAADTAVQGLMRLHQQIPVSLTTVAEGLALHLDVAQPEQGLVPQCWLWLANTLTAAAKHVLQQQGNSPQQAGNDGEEQHGSGDTVASQAWQTWEALQKLLPVQRHWWSSLHFSWQQQAAAAADQGAATASTFTAQAVCCALIFSIDATGEREQTEQYLTKVQRHLEEAGAGSLAQDVAYSLKLAKHIVKAQRQRALIRDGTPFNKPLAKFGLVPNLPDVWWCVFPFKRRRQASID